VDLRDAGDPVELGALYAQQGADELVFLDITATVDNRKTLVNLVREVARHVNIPFTVGGGISSIKDVSDLLNAGADKVSINSSAVRRPELVDELALQFGSQCIIVAIDTRFVDGNDWVHTHGGRKITEIQTMAWAKEVESRGAGEILLTSMDADGTKAGYDLELTRQVADLVEVPVIASGGAGNCEHILQAVTEGKAEAALLASLLHYGELTITEIKEYLSAHQVPVRSL